MAGNFDVSQEAKIVERKAIKACEDLLPDNVKEDPDRAAASYIKDAAQLSAEITKLSKQHLLEQTIHQVNIDANTNTNLLLKSVSADVIERDGDGKITGVRFHSSTWPCGAQSDARAHVKEPEAGGMDPKGKESKLFKQ